MKVAGVVYTIFNIRSARWYKVSGTFIVAVKSAEDDRKTRSKQKPCTNVYTKYRILRKLHQQLALSLSQSILLHHLLEIKEPRRSFYSVTSIADTQRTRSDSLWTKCTYRQPLTVLKIIQVDITYRRETMPMAVQSRIYERDLCRGRATPDGAGRAIDALSPLRH